MDDLKVIGITGYAQSGKDTFCNYALEFLADKKIRCTRKAFADALKKDVHQLCIQKIGVNSFSGNPVEKELIRPLLVAYGTDIMRKLNDKHWIERLNLDLDICRELKVLPIITDLRYENEMQWLQEELGGVAVHITRLGTGPANAEEKAQNPILKKRADYRIQSPDYGEEEIEKCRPKVRSIMEKIYTSYLS